MDELQPWFGYYFRLQDIGEIAKNVSRELYKNKKFHEIFLTWAFASFLSKVNSVEYVIGFPALNESKEDKITLLGILDGSIALDEDFDTVMARVDKLDKSHCRLQIKRYIPKGKPDTMELFNYIMKTLKHYGKCESLYFLFDIQSQMGLDLHKLNNLCTNTKFEVGGVTLFAQDSSDKMPLFLPLHPVSDRSRIIHWKPAG